MQSKLKFRAGISWRRGEALDCRGAHRPRAARGFTLIELMVVILIIVILITILIPAVAYVKTLSKKAATSALFNSLDMGLETYYRDFGYFPPSTPTNSYGGSGGPNLDNGGLMLAEGLTGYLNGNFDGAGNPPYPNDPAYGFRIRSGGNGKVYGPYAQPGGSSWQVSTTNANHQYFIDLWGNEILYYRAVPTTANGIRRSVTSVFGTTAATPFQSVFYSDDNLTAYDATHTGEKSVADPSTYQPFLKLLGASANNLTPGDSVIGRESYLLVSAGPDGQYFVGHDSRVPTTSTPDDILGTGK